MKGMLKRISISLLLLTSVVFCYGQSTTGEIVVTGFAGGNSDSPILLYRYADPISGHEQFVAVTHPDSSGRFSFTIQESAITHYFIRNGKHDNHFFAGDSSRIDIICYPFESLSQSAVSDPFFTFERVAAADKNSCSLNNLISELEEQYETALLRQSGRSQITTEQPLPTGSLHITGCSLMADHPFADAWSRYREASLKVAHMVNTSARRKILSEYDRYFDPANQAATELVSSLYSGYLRELLTGRGGDIVARVMEEGRNPALLTDIVIRETGLGRKSAEYILLDNLYREFFDLRFERPAIVAVTAWFVENGANDKIKSIASSLHDLMRGLLTGGELPGFVLTGNDGELYSPESFTGKHLLLAFVDTRSFITWPELELLKNNIAPYLNYIEIVAVMCDPDFGQAQASMKSRGYNWLMLDASGEYGLQSAYSTRPLPLFVLAGPESEVISRPASWPSENLLKLIGTTLQPYLLNDIGNRAPASR
ncbi:MAG: hypothetical protein LC649_08740 [Bacteroidales bacterium]|nr:hypothetical protein [Bacteroidales bacterium]